MLVCNECGETVQGDDALIIGGKPLGHWRLPATKLTNVFCGPLRERTETDDVEDCGETDANADGDLDGTLPSSRQPR